ncbi:MAG: class I SAM-dependent methyltransferase [Anaerolineaceae bacterium]
MKNNERKGFLNKILAYPDTINMNVDDPKVTYQRRTIIREKRLLHAIYQEWYSMQFNQLPDITGKVLEIGSGAGFFDEINTQTITSEIFFCPFVNAILDGVRLPFPDESLRAIAMTDVFHHIPDVDQFLNEGMRVLKPGGRIIMVEPWVTRWSRWVMDHFHSEPMDVEMKTWQFPSQGPLSSSNQALPWIVFQRDRQVFEQKYPNLKITMLIPCIPFRYLLSGGVSIRSLVPAGCNSFLKSIEKCFNSKNWAMFALIVLEKKLNID